MPSPCLSFWLIGSLVGCGKVQQAKELFEEMLGYANHLGLYSEMIDPHTKQALGNFPQAFSHIGLIHTARNLSAACSSRLAAPPPSVVPAQAGTPTNRTYPFPRRFSHPRKP